MPVRLSADQARRMGVGAAESHSPPRKGKGASIPRAGVSERTGLSSLIKLGWSVQSPDSVRYLLYKLGEPEMNTGLRESEKAACDCAKELIRAKAHQEAANG